MVRPSQLSPMQRLLLAISLPITLVFLYFLFRKSDDEDDEEADAKAVSSRQTTIEVKVPYDAIGAVIGVQGAQIKMIRNVTKARLNFKDKGDNEKDKRDRTLVIQGTQEGVKKAELMVRQIIVDQPQIETEVVHVPQSSVGRIIGRNGETIRLISHQSKAKVTIDRTTSNDPDNPVEIQLKGTPVAIDVAKSLIKEKVDEDHKASLRSSKGKPKPPVEAGGLTIKSKDSNSDSYSEVYVSAVEHPGHFWVQFLDRDSIKLNQLVEKMTMFYGHLDKPQEKKMMLEVGDIVAAPFEDDNSWYRARIVSVVRNEVDLYFVDYGDSLMMSKDRVRKLRYDFEDLPVQAKECSLANVKPAVGNEWSEEAITFFEDLVHVAKWRVLMSKTVISSDETSDSLSSIQLIDTNGEKDVDIAAELVKKGYAVHTHTDSIANKVA